MAKTPSFTTIYGKNANNERVPIGIKVEGGQLLEGVKHPNEVKPKAKVSTKPSTKTTTKKFSFGRKSKK